MALDLHIPLQRPRVREHATAWRDADRGRAAELLTERAGAKQGQTKDAIALLKEDHTKVRALLGELEETSEQAASTREHLLATIETALTIHTKIEEEIFYPAFRAAAEKRDDKELYYEALEEHHVVDLVLPEIKATPVAAHEFGAKAKVLKDLVEHHAEEEETQMFPRAKKLMDRAELVLLGGELASAKQAMMTGVTRRGS